MRSLPSTCPPRSTPRDSLCPRCFRTNGVAASAHGLVTSPFKSAYVAAKHGIIGLTKVTPWDDACDPLEGVILHEPLPDVATVMEG